MGKRVHRAFIEELPSPYGSQKIWTRALCEETHRVVETDNDFPVHEIRYTAVPADPIARVLWYLDRDSCDAEHIL